MEEDLLKLTDELQQEAQCIPNMTHQDVPIGDEDCSTIRTTVSILICIWDFLRETVSYKNDLRKQESS